MSTGSTVLVVIVVIVLVVLAGVAWYTYRSRQLRSRFGPEYERAVEAGGGRLSAERELRQREQRHAQLELRPLSDQARQRYQRAWEDVQARFVDDPAAAVGTADELVTRLIEERGYPTGEFDQQVADLSVEHAATLDRYRQAHDISLRNERGEADTEELRQALVHYRALFADLLGTDPVDSPEPTEAS